MHLFIYGPYTVDLFTLKSPFENTSFPLSVHTKSLLLLLIYSTHNIFMHMHIIHNIFMHTHVKHNIFMHIHMKIKRFYNT